MLDSIVFEDVDAAEIVYDPFRAVSSISRTVRVTNQGEEDLQDLGCFLQVTTSLGDVDDPADFPPETDYQDLLTWGSRTSAGVTLVGGLKLSLPQNDGSILTQYISRTNGSGAYNKMPFKDLVAGASADFTILLETPPGVPARRLYINLTLE